MDIKPVWYAENTKLADLLSTDELLAAEFSKRTMSKKRGDYVYLPGEKSDSVFFILSGKVRLGAFRESEKETVTAILTEGDVFGQNSFSSAEKRKDFAMAAEDTKVVEFKKEELRRLMSQNIQLGIYYLNFLNDRMTELEGKLESLVYMDSKSRIIAFLLASVEKSGQRMGYEWVVRGFLTHMDIASLTSTSRQTVTMILNELRQENIIDFDRKRLIVRDLARLKSMLHEKP